MPRRAPALATKTAEGLLSQFGEQLKQRRTVLGVSQAEAAESAGMSRPTLSKIEHGSGSVTIAAFVAAAEVLGMELRLVRRGSEPRVPATIRLDDYPSLRKLAWDMPGTEVLEPVEVFDMLQRNDRYLDRDDLSDSERHLIALLTLQFGQG